MDTGLALGLSRPILPPLLAQAFGVLSEESPGQEQHLRPVRLLLQSVRQEGCRLIPSDCLPDPARSRVMSALPERTCQFT